MRCQPTGEMVLHAFAGRLLVQHGTRPLPLSVLWPRSQLALRTLVCPRRGAQADASHHLFEAMVLQQPTRPRTLMRPLVHHIKIRFCSAKPSSRASVSPPTIAVLAEPCRSITRKWRIAAADRSRSPPGQQHVSEYSWRAWQAQAPWHLPVRSGCLRNRVHAGLGLLSLDLGSRV